VRAEFAEERDGLVRELEQARADFADEREGLERELEQARAGFAGQRARTEQELEQVRARFAGERERLEQELEELAWELSGRQRAERELDQVRVGERERAGRELEQAHARFAEERERLERSLGEATGDLARAKGELRLLGEHSTEMISRYDERGICLYASSASRRLLGYEPEELVGRAGAGLLHPDDRHRLARARAARCESTFEARLLRKAGDFIWVEVSLHPVWGRETDRLLGVTTIVRDISDRQDLRERMRAREEVRRFTPGHTPPNQTAA
jgi:PAS domain S-box-containing protein